MAEDFDLNRLNQIIDGALENKTPESPSQSLLSYNDTKLLQSLSTILLKYLHQADVQAIIDSLRTELFKDLDLGNLRHMHSVIQRCRKCPAVIGAPTLPQWNLSNPDVIFIAENPFSNDEVASYLVSSLVKSGFKSTNICLTYATRCPIRGTPDKTELDNCSTYLLHEIQLLQPKLIVPMGSTVASMLLSSIKITESHGVIYWLGPWAIMPMLGPMHVLKTSNQAGFDNDLASAYRFVYGDKVV